MATWLSDVRVLEAGQGLALAYAGHLLARLGAEVWKLEPAGGDPLRLVGPFPGDVPHKEKSAYHLFYNGGKKSVMEGPGVARRLAAACHIILADREWARRLGVRRWARRGHVVVVVTPFGLTGPYKELPATDLTLQALMGLSYISGEPYRPPLRVGLPIPELAAGQLAAGAALAALWRRYQEDCGALVDLSIWEAALTTMEHAPMIWSYRKVVWQRRGNLGGVAGWGIYPCRDGYVGVITGLAQAYQEFLRWVGPPLDDPKFQSMSARTRYADEMHAAILSWLADKGREEVVEEAQRRGLPFGYLHRVDDLLQSRQLRARRFFWKVRHPQAGELTLPYAPFRAEGVEWRPCLAPSLGRHSKQARTLMPLPTGLPPHPSPPLKGIRVLEMAVVWAGPLCGRLLAEAGAEVIKLETARRPDLMRGPARPSHPAEGVYPNGQPGEEPWNRHAYFNDRNRGKWGVCLNLDHPRGRELAQELAARCDIIIENLSPGALAPFGLDYSAVRRRRPDIIYLSMPTQGLTGPERHYVGYGATNDLTSGLISLTGYEDGTPQNAGINVSDPLAAFHGFVAVLAALHYRRRTGRGIHIDLSQRESTTYFMAPYILDYVWNGRVQGPMGNHHPIWAPHGIYPCQGEDRWVAIAVRTDEEWQALCKLAGEPLLHMASLTTEERLARQDELDRVLAQWTSQQEQDDVWRNLIRVGVPAAPVYDAPGLFSDPHLRARRFWRAVPHPQAGRRLYPGSPWRLDGTPTPQTPAPTLGQHNRLVLSRLLGLGEEELEALERDGILAYKPMGA